MSSQSNDADDARQSHSRALLCAAPQSHPVTAPMSESQGQEGHRGLIGRWPDQCRTLGYIHQESIPSTWTSLL